jgi:membrane glycosyltransferase
MLAAELRFLRYIILIAILAITVFAVFVGQRIVVYIGTATLLTMIYASCLKSEIVLEIRGE